MRVQFWKQPKASLTPEEIKAAAERDAALGAAKHADKMDRFKTSEARKLERAQNTSARRIDRIKAKAERRKAKVEAGDKPIPMAVRIVQFSGFAALVAGIAVAIAGYWYDILFYAQQSDEWYVILGLVAFAFTLRTVAVFVPIVLQWAKPPPRKMESRRYLFRFWKNKPTNLDTDGDGEVSVKEFIAGNRLARATLRFLFVGSVIGCSFATLSFFSAGHEVRQAKVASIEAMEKTSVQGKNERIDALRSALEDARKDRDTDIAAAQFSITAIKDEVVGMSAADNESIRKLQDDITKYRDGYAKTRDTIQEQINSILSEKEEAETLATEERGNNAPFLTVYSFLSRTAMDEGFWAVSGTWFFTILFEMLIAFFPGAMFELFRALTGRVRMMEAHESQQSLRWGLEISQFESGVRLEGLKAQALRDSEESSLRIAIQRQQARDAEQRAEVEREIADAERKAKQARERLDAIAAGEDAEVYDARKDLEREKRRAEADKKRAEAEGEIAKIKAETDRIRREAEEAAKPPPPKPEPPGLTPQQQAAENARRAADLARAAKGAAEPGVPVGKWRDRPDRVLNGAAS